MAKTRALLTETEREQIAGEHGDSRRYQAASRIRSRIQEELGHDIDVLEQYHPELLAELREVVLPDAPREQAEFYDEVYTVGDKFHLEAATPFSTQTPPTTFEIIAIRPAIGDAPFGVILGWEKDVEGAAINASYADIREVHDAVIDGRVRRKEDENS